MASTFSLKRIRPSQEHTPQWYALRTRARAEQQAGLRLEALGVEVITATPRIERQWSDRKKRIRTPLFAGYIFGRFALQQFGRVLGVPGVAGVVRMGDRPVPVRPEELEAVRILTEGVDELGELPALVDPLAPGDAVEVVAGPFKGMTGTLLHLQGSTGVAVRIDAIRQARAVRMPMESVRPVG